MDLNEIKHIIEKEGGKIIVVENNRPLLVILPYEEYRGRGQSLSPVNRAEFQRNEPRVPAESVSQEQETAPRELTIDDLPL